MNNNDALREALERLLTWPNPNGTIERAYIPGWLAKQCRDALAASKPEPDGFVSEDVQLFAIQVEKLLCEKLGWKWSASGMSIQTLADELARRAASKPEPQVQPWSNADSGVYGPEYQNQEPQAQAGEPEVMAWVERWYGSGPELGWWIVCGRNHIVHLGAEVLGDGDTVRKIVDAHNSAIAKKDAALKACVDVCLLFARWAQAVQDFRYPPGSLQQLHAAITQAQEARK